MTDKKTIVVTGGAGFIGSHLCARLIKEGHKVISLDNYFTGSRDNHFEGVEYRDGHTKDIEKHISETPDMIFHFGEYSRVAKSLEEPELVWDLNMLGTFGVLEFWRKKGGKLVYAGSSTKQVGAREDGVEGRDLSPYTWMKAANSELVLNYGRWYSLPHVITYFYNVYGPGERAGVGSYGTVIATFIDCLKKGKACEVREPGTQSRNFTHVEDTINGIILAAEKGHGEGYSISAKESHTLLDIAKSLGTEIKMLPPTKTTRSHSVLNTEKIEALGWKQKYKLSDYIEEIKQQKND